jgi:toxin ParE1/3/4
MKVIWSPRAIRHLAHLREYIARDSEERASLVSTRILDALALLAVQPGMGRPGRLLHTRELVVSKTPYVIPYRVRRDTIELIAVLHGRQKWPAKL